MVVSADSEWSHTPAVRLPSGDIGGSVRGFITHELGRPKPSSHRLRGLASEFRQLLLDERFIDTVLLAPSARRRRVLEPAELNLLMAVFPEDRSLYCGEIKDHWDKSIRALRRSNSMSAELSEYLEVRREFDPDAELVGDAPRCDECAVGLRKMSEVTEYCGVHVPNELGIRDERVIRYQCPDCGVESTVRVDA